MTRLLPRTLFAQMLAILLAGLVVSYFAGSWIFAHDRQAAVRALGSYAATQRIANLARLIDTAPPLWRERIVAASGDPTLRIALAPTAPVVPPADATARMIAAALADQLPPPLARTLRVAVLGSAVFVPPSMAMMHGAPMPPGMMGDFTPWRVLSVAMRLNDGQWLRFVATLPEASGPASWPFIAALLSMAAAVALASAWAVRRITAPLGVLVDAAERLGRDINAPPVVGAGSLEMRHAARVFNEMQARLQRVIAVRTRMLGALSHDLRTPLTLLRLRAEALPDTEERERMLANIGDLQAMIAATLQLARDEAVTEPSRRVDLTALVEAMVHDMQDAGLPVRLADSDPVVLDARPIALRRALGNLIDNAVKYGGAAEVSVHTTATTARVRVEDPGPGIPAAERERVFEPFHRLEPSRSRETGGVGLGLAIARSVAHAHGGDVALSERPGGGLRAELCLPRAPEIATA